MFLALSFARRLLSQTTCAHSLCLWGAPGLSCTFAFPHFTSVRSDPSLWGRCWTCSACCRRPRNLLSGSRSFITLPAPSLRAYLGASSARGKPKTSTALHLGAEKRCSLSPQFTSFSRRPPTKTTTNSGISAMKKKTEELK